jgi:hypothetical protein
MSVARDEAKWVYWTKQIKDWQASGLSRNAYCKREGLKPTTFDYWRPLMVLHHAEAKPLTQPLNSHDITLVPVALSQPLKVVAANDVDDVVREVPPAATAPGHPVSQPLKLKSPSGWEMQLPVSVDPKWLITVLRQLP